MFKHSNYEKHGSLDISTKHIEYYMRSILKFELINDTQIRIIEALLTVQKLILFNRLHKKLNWKPQIPYNILKSEWKYEVFEDLTNEKVEEIAIVTHKKEMYIRDEGIGKKTMKEQQYQN